MGEMRKIAVLTYPVKHRKTYDVLGLLKANGYQDVRVYAVPFRYQKKKFPLIEHRPEMNFRVPDIGEMCSHMGYQYEAGGLGTFHIGAERLVLVAGAGILPDEFIRTHAVLNAHPGYIPDCRGLDALKWAIAEKKPIGVTTHVIGEYVDAGEVIERRRIDVRKTDTFHAVAARVYENEVSMLVEAIRKYDEGQFEMIYPGDSEVHKRMPEDMERNLLGMFEEYKERYAMEGKRLGISGGGQDGQGRIMTLPSSGRRAA